MCVLNVRSSPDTPHFFMFLRLQPPQRQMLKLIESNGNGGGFCGMGSSGMSNGSMSGGLTGEGLGVSSSSIGAQAVEKPPEFQGRRRRR
jgi:hypothetical protein